MNKLRCATSLFLVVKICFVLMMTNAHAQTNVYRCKTPEGGVIFQQQSCSDNQVSGDSQHHKMWRILRRMTADGISVLSRLGPDVESIKACRVNVDAYRLRLDALESKMAKLTYTHPHLMKSYEYLYECAVCKTSAEAFCHSSNRSLDEAMKALVEN